MSLEAAIQENTAAIRELIAAMGARAAAVQSVLDNANAAIKEVTAETKKQAEVVAKSPAEVKKASADAKKPDVKTASSQPGAKPETTGQADAAPDYEQVKQRVLQLAKDQGREKVTALLSRYGVAKATELKADQYAAIIGDLDRALAGEYDPEAADAELA